MNEELLLKKSYYALLDVIKNLKWIILIAMLCGMCGFTVARTVYVPKYESSTTYIVKSKSVAANAYTSLTQAQTLVDMLDVLVSSEEFENVVLDRTKWERMPCEIYANVIPETNLIVIGCSADNPRDAFLGIKTVMEICPEMMNTVTESAAMLVFRTPEVAVKASNTSGATKISVYSAVIAGIVSTVIFAYVSFSGKKINDSKQLTDNLNTVMLQSLPFEAPTSIFYRGRNKKRGILINNFDCTERYEEAIKGLRAKITAEKKDAPLSVLVCSTLPGEGKTTVSANIALSLAMAGKKVALIDFDIYKHSLTSTFPMSVNGSNVIEDYLYSDAGYQSGVKIDSQTGIIMFLGKKGNSQKKIFPVERALKLVDFAKNYADYVVIDTPPISLFADSAELSDGCDISLLVVKEHYATDAEVMESISVLKNGKAPFIGCVFSGERLNGSSVSYGYGYGKYGSYGYGKYGDEKEEESND